ncbi:MAG: amino acid permease [Candidatus Eisenbacteria bacterium]|nr:amino acid permease [Candidatus Eisenbacteria bacterium]
MELRKELGLLDVFTIASGAMISSGLFVLPGVAFASAGPSVIVAYALAGIFVLPALFSKAELSTAMPKAGGTYFYIERSLGGALGTIGGMASWFSLTFKSAFALLGMGSFAVLVIPDIGPSAIKLIAVGLTGVFVVVNLMGAKHAGRLQSTLVLALIATLIFYLIRGAPAIDVQRYVPFAPGGWAAVFASAGLVFVAYGGLTKVASVAEEVKNPTRNIPLGMLLAFFIVTALYVAAVFVAVGVTDAEALAGSRTPISTAAQGFMGTPGLVIMAAAALIAFTTTGNAGILSASRIPMAMSRDGMLPSFFGRASERRKIPHVGILVTGGIMVAAIAFLDLETLVKVASTMMIILFLLVNLSVIIMRESRMQHYRPSFTSPLYPWVQGTAIALYGFIVFRMGSIPLLVTAVFFGGSLIWYVAYAKRNERKDSALIQLVRRITSSDLVTSSLDTELREILKVRDEIVEDRFDGLVKRATILDIEGGMSLHQFFRKVAKVLAHELEKTEDEIYSLLIEREDQSTTALRPGLAIPHIVVEGEKVFDILLARCSGGIKFSEELPPVHAVFVLIGSLDERNYHLRALMHIAQLTHDPDFDDRWKKARGPEELRNIVLLSERRRDPDLDRP